MQFHLIAPLILIPFALKKPIIGVIISILILVANITASAVIISQNPGFELGTLGGNPIFFTDAYIVPWFRIGPYIVGLLLGYIIYLKKTSTKPNYINPKLNISLWIFSLFLLCLMVFGNYPNFSGNAMKKWINITYESTAKIIWSIGLSYVIFANVTGNGGVINRILSWKMWKPLAKISFSVYLIHSFVLSQVISTELRPIFIQDTIMVYRFLGNLALSLIAGYLVHIFIELPLAAFEKHIFKS
ncbi:nose resistant to fluoxetine 6-like [Brachionus plicatilis]|uniref:Nose resistant to fluoxetine 6-like n=1 Tax=Brachionus plicatilis TaxID=10195 RepID=A0A3M7Q412_BRAPC|nr:nose resistant to fluoxetine 6-like [Brachionus plicatilis]